MEKTTIVEPKLELLTVEAIDEFLHPLRLEYIKDCIGTFEYPEAIEKMEKDWEGRGYDMKKHMQKEEITKVVFAEIGVKEGEKPDMLEVQKKTEAYKSQFLNLQALRGELATLQESIEYKENMIKKYNGYKEKLLEMKK